MMKLHTITRVKPFNILPRSLLLTFDGAEEAMVDMSPMLAQGGVFEPLRDPKVFEAVEIESDGRTLLWRVGEDVVDLCADALWLMAHPDADRQPQQQIRSLQPEAPSSRSRLLRPLPSDERAAAPRRPRAPRPRR